MRMLSFLLTALLYGLTVHAQNAADNWESIRNGDVPDKITISLDGINVNFELTQNNAFSEELIHFNEALKSFDLNNSELNIIGKLTLDDDQVFIHLKEGSQLSSYHLSNDAQEYQVSKATNKAACGTKDSPKFYGQNHVSSNIGIQKSAGDLNYGDVLSTYRLALIGTGEFTENNGGTASSALTVAVSTVNGINLIFESEASISLTLVESQFYLDSSTDPFIPELAGGDSRTNQSAEVMAMNFSNSSYDIGHVLHHYSFGSDWGGGGIAGLGTVCDNGTFFSTAEATDDGLTGPNKGAAWSGSFNNTTNSWIQLISHELGHQFDALHSFNGGGNGNCNSGISSTTAYEIGSGTTIMSYSGLCPSSQNVPSNGAADNYFHSTTLDQILIFKNSLNLSCAVESAANNSIPIVTTENTQSPTIPIGTPFELKGTGTDADGDALLYSWEQIDEDGPGTPTQGFIGSQAANSTIAPLFKSKPPSPSPQRQFPSLANMLVGQNENLSFEALPQVTRSITFSFIARDNQGAVNSEELIVNSSSTAGPFKVSSNNSAEIWTAGNGNTAIVTWDVANTDNATINCQNVDILFSNDNGQSFPYILASGTPNDGSHSIQVPNLPTEIGRIKIKASANIFFDINDSYITIESSCQANGTSFIPENDVEADEGDPILDLDLSPEYGSEITSFEGVLEDTDSPTNLVTAQDSECVSFTGQATVGEPFPFQVDESGTYDFTKALGGFGVIMHIYTNEYFPSNPCTNWVAGSFDNDQGVIHPTLSLNLIADLDYILVVTGFSPTIPSNPESFEITYDGPGAALDGTAAPEGFIYQFVIADENGQILDIVLDANLQMYLSGVYSVTGLSADINTDYSNYIGGALSTLETDILALTVCGGFSTNSIQVVILPADCPGDLNGDGIIGVGDLSPFLSQFGCNSNCTADMNGDGQVTIADLSPFLSIFGDSCD